MTFACVGVFIVFIFYRQFFLRPVTAYANVLFCAEDDGDMKIAGSTFSPARQSEDSAEFEAKQFLLQKSVGNIDKARDLGKSYADAMIEMANNPSAETLTKTQQEVHHRLLLCSYIVNRVIAEHSPNSILAQTSLNVFYNEVETTSLALYLHVSDMAAFSLYILCERSSNRGDDEIGRIYARLCGFENDPHSIAEGNELYRKFYDFCVDKIHQTAYSEVETI